LLTYNGGKPQPNCFKNSSVECFFYIGKSIAAFPVYSLEYKIGVYQTPPVRVSSDLLPIGGDEGGNLICLGVRGSRYGCIYFWDHEQEGSSRIGRKVAKTFAGFLDSLYEPRRNADEEKFLIAVGIQRDDIVGEMIDNGFSPDFVDPNHGMTVLEYSAYFHNPVLTQLLLEKGARVNLENAIKLAEQRKNWASLELLRKYQQH
jgi:hypothetical protein